MSKEEKQVTVHLDTLGRELKVGDAVACPQGATTLMIGRITSLGKKQVRVVKYGQSEKFTRWNGHLVLNGKMRYSKEVVLLDGPDITVYLLKLNSK